MTLFDHFMDDIREALKIDRKHTPPRDYKPLHDPHEPVDVAEWFKAKGLIVEPKE